LNNIMRKAWDLNFCGAARLLDIPPGPTRSGAGRGGGSS